MDNKDLIKLAIESRSKAYVPYSGFHVGAAVETRDGTVYTGCNIEIASYSPTICAERNAIFKAISEGHDQIRKVVVVADGKNTFPCGVCRQVIREFGEEVEIIIANDEKDYKVYSLEELLPHSFGPKDLKKGEEHV